MLSDMLHTLNTHNTSKTCITWTQNVFRYHKVKTNGAKGRLWEKIAAVLFVLTLSLADLTSSVDWLRKLILHEKILTICVQWEWNY